MAQATCAYSTPAPAPLYPVSRWIPGARALTRQEAEGLVEALIGLFDRHDGDADLEPSLGSLDATTHSDFSDQEEWAAGADRDCEAGDDNGIADAEGMDWVARRAA
ncbi:hypothetical protein Q8W71_13820 [Methylobacterium sp. NEAU 140]|uniref:hypothetical protein n=1 Tax=Methylobacterium sp. NEAU 140 TaxID=3064945 RepID=UPI002733C2B5|nr:hypothetical protein [Methylobacterium sp. NEAU 140]MDP4023709.1 hypothetical protein [Methylobacterium sp. NEAU 140]